MGVRERLDKRVAKTYDMGERTDGMAKVAKVTGREMRKKMGGLVFSWRRSLARAFRRTERQESRSALRSLEGVLS